MTEQEKPSFLTFLIYGILFTNDLVCDEITLAYHKLKDHPLFRHKVKQQAKKLLTKSKEYKKYITLVIGKDNTTFLADSNDIYNAGIDKHVQILHITCKNILDRHNVEHSDIIAHLQLVNVLCQIAVAKVHNSDRIVLEQKLTTKRFTRLSLSHILRLSNQLNEIIYTGNDIDFTADEQYNLAVRVLTKKLCDADVITKAICKDE